MFVVQPDPDPDMVHRPYIELGGSGLVLQLLGANTSTYYALKIFNNPYPAIVNNTKILEKNMVWRIPGLKVAQRNIINPELNIYKDLIQRYPYLEYSVLMPWVGGYTWFEILGDSKWKSNIPAFTRGASLYYASQLARALASIEARGYAHCDICSNNIILDFKSSSVQLIDIEDMYLPGARKSKDFIGGQSGYAHPNNPLGHQWVEEGDRFGGGLLICELLTWSNPKIRGVSDSESFATPLELGKDSKKYYLMKDTISQQGSGELAALFERLWNSESLKDCPTLGEWEEQISLVTKPENNLVPVLDGLSQLGADGRIRIQRKRISVTEEPKQSISTTHKKIVDESVPREKPSLPEFRPSYNFPLSSLFPPEPPNVTSTVAIGFNGKKIKVSVSYPLFLSKRFESVFLCQIYWDENRSRVLKNIKAEFRGEKFNEKNQISKIKAGQKITVRFSSQNFSFSESVTKTIDDSIVKIQFLGKPNDNCETGFHKIKISFLDTETGEEFDYMILTNVKVVDFAFDHVSRPLLSRVSAVVLGIGSFAMFVLSFLEQIDKTIGLTSGTAAGILAAMIYANFYNLYQRIRPNTP